MSSDSPSPVSGTIPAGWYPDPAGGDGKRWWDGSAWTQNVQAPEVVAPPPSFGSFVPVGSRPATPVASAEVGIGYTRASWWIAGSPLWVVVPQAALYEVFASLAPLPTPTLLLGGALFSALALAILVGLAFSDRAALLRGGNDTVASPWWTLLTPLAYLIARARQVQFYATGGWASVIWWCLAAFVSPGVAVLAIFAVIGLV